MLITGVVECRRKSVERRLTSVTLTLPSGAGAPTVRMPLPLAWHLAVALTDSTTTERGGSISVPDAAKLVAFRWKLGSLSCLVVIPDMSRNGAALLRPVACVGLIALRRSWDECTVRMVGTVALEATRTSVSSTRRIDRVCRCLQATGMILMQRCVRTESSSQIQHRPWCWYFEG